MTYLRRLALALLMIGTFNQVSAQANTTPIQELSLDSGTIDNQFEYVIRRSNSWQDFKVIKKNWMYTLKAHTMDSLKALHEQLDATKKVVETQKSEIDELRTNLGNTQSTLDATNLEKDSMTLFGLQMSKGAYNTLLWSVIAGLFVLLLVFIYKFRNSNAVTRAAKLALEETEQEFEEHRRVALEREQKVRRQLQDEINKQKGA